MVKIDDIDSFSLSKINHSNKTRYFNRDGLQSLKNHPKNQNNCLLLKNRTKP
ncbi:hypothetical protein PPRY_a2363 [Pseudoalteromonas prydzensis ACAM 620]|nr:hypothetical protein [Pseudoalteromonas prydzensis ACAM 620]